MVVPPKMTESINTINTIIKPPVMPPPEPPNKGKGIKDEESESLIEKFD